MQSHDFRRSYPFALTGLVLAGCFVVAAFNPVGYVGSGQDDMRYLTGVECLVRHGFCVPTNHWEARLPFLYPAAAVAAVFGESREALWIAPFLFSVAAITFFGLCVAEVFGRRAGSFAALLFLLCAEIANRLLDYTVDLPEFAFLAGGTLCLLRRHAVAAGILFGLAVLCRPTVIAFAPLVAFYLVRAKSWDLMLTAGAATAAVLVVQAFCMGALAGDMLLTWRLSLNHNAIPSSYLDYIPFRSNPLFNMDLVRAWPPAAEVETPWQIRAPINFLAFPTVIVLHAATVVALLLARSRRLNGLALAAAGYFIILAYGFAIDPKPRMFLPVIAIECAIVAAFAVRPTGPSRLLAMISIGGLGLVCYFTSFDRPDFRAGASVVADWLTRDPSLKVEAVVSSQLEVRILRREVYVGEGGRLVALVSPSCRQGLGGDDLPQTATIEREQRIPRTEPRLIQAMRSMPFLVQARPSESVCIYRIASTPRSG